MKTKPLPELHLTPRATSRAWARRLPGREGATRRILRHTGSRVVNFLVVNTKLVLTERTARI